MLERGGDGRAAVLEEEIVTVTTWQEGGRKTFLGRLCNRQAHRRRVSKFVTVRGFGALETTELENDDNEGDQLRR